MGGESDVKLWLIAGLVGGAVFIAGAAVGSMALAGIGFAVFAVVLMDKWRIFWRLLEGRPNRREAEWDDDDIKR